MAKSQQADDGHLHVGGNKENMNDSVGLPLAVQSLWSGMVNKLIQQNLRAKKFDQVWPEILDEIILRGFAGTY